MKKILFATAVIVLCYTSMSRAQNYFACTAVGGSANETGNMIIQTNDSGYAVAGYANSFGAANPDFCVTKLDSAGNLQWTELIRGGNADGLSAIEQTGDGGYVVGGYTTSVTGFDNDFYIAKLNNNGILQWDKDMGRFNFDFAFSVHQTFDGGYVMAGQSNSTLSGDYDFYITKLDTSGNLLWSKMIGGPNSDMAYAMQQTADSGYVLAGVTNSFGSGSNDVYVVKLDTSGSLQWSTAIGGSTDETGNSIVQTTDGGYAVAGVTNSFGAGGNDVYVIKLDSGGTIVWTRTIGGSNPDYGSSIQQTADGGYIVGGASTSFNGIGWRAYLVKLDGSGNLQWTSSAAAPGDLLVSSVDQTYDGGYVIGGSYAATGSSTYDFMILKFDAAGNSCCPANTGGTVDSGGVAVSGGVLSTLTSVVQGISASDTLVAATLSAYCIGTGMGEETPNHSFSIVPNPAEGHFVIKADGTVHEGVIQLYNGMGQKMLEEAFSNESTHEINVSNNTPGIYLLNLRAKMAGNAGSYYSEKVVIR